MNHPLSRRVRALVPAPLAARAADGFHVLSGDVALHVESASPEDAGAVLRSARAILPLPVAPSGSESRAIHVRVADDPELPAGAEAYRLAVTPDLVAIECRTRAGAINALHTLRQLLPADACRFRPADAITWDLPCCEIEDAPRFAWRGVLLDVSRHYLPKAEVLKHIRVLTSFKINRIQLHLTDDQGWRIAVPEYPQLESVASWRRRTQRAHHDVRDPEFEEAPHGGIYSLADLREFCELAVDLGAQIVPEIEMPGHSAALLAAFPEIGSPRDAAREVAQTWGVHNSLISPTDEALDFLVSLVRRILEDLPGDYLHVGADESRIEDWLEDPEVMELARNLGVSNPGDLFERVLSRADGLAQELGRTVLTWDEDFATEKTDEGAGRDRIVVAWRGMEIARRTAAAGRQVVLAPMYPCYFDNAQSEVDSEPMAIGGPVTLADVLGWQPVPASWSPDEARGVLGVQGQLWTEHIPDGRAVDYMLYPRALALSDVAWRSHEPSVEARLSAVEDQLERLDAFGVEYRPLEGPHPWQRPGKTWRRPYPSRPVQISIEVHEAAALEGRVPTEADFIAAAERWEASRSG